MKILAIAISKFGGSRSCTARLLASKAVRPPLSKARRRGMFSLHQHILMYT